MLAVIEISTNGVAETSVLACKIHLAKKLSCKSACINEENYAQHNVLLLWLKGYAALHKYVYSEPSWILSSDNGRCK
jgi:hypothetical protein